MASSSSRSIPDGPSTSGRRSSLRQQLPDLQPALLLGQANINANDRTVRKLLIAAGNGEVSSTKKWANKLIELGRPSVDAAVEAVDNPESKRHGPLHLAAGTGNEETCKLLINRFKCSVNATDVYGWTPLFFAVQGTESLSVIRLLIDHGADQNKADNCGITPLHIAAERGSYEVAEFLLSKGAEVDPICKYGETPLHIAAENGDAKMVKLLLQHNADHGRLSCGFHTPLTMSLFGSSLECLEILIEAGADINADTHLTPLKIAAAQGLADCIECLLKAGAKANIPDELGRMPIEIAAFEGRVECVKILFPATTPLVKYANWSIDEIIRNGLTERLREGSKVKAEGDTAFRKKDYIFASTRYTLALKLVPNDSDLYAKRSLCYLRMGDKENALPDAITYRDMQQDLPKSSSEQGAALTLVLEYGREFEAFMSGLNLGYGSGPTDETDEASREEHP